MRKPNKRRPDRTRYVRRYRRQWHGRSWTLVLEMMGVRG